MILRIVDNQKDGYKVARWGDCVYSTYVGKRHTPVMPQISGTITTRPGELCVVVEATK